MGAKLKPVADLATYWKRERDFQRRLPLIDGEEMISLDTPVEYRILPSEPPHTREWEQERIRLACAMLPQEFKRYQKVLWAIYRNRGRRRLKIAHSCGYTTRQYRTVFVLLWHFYTERRGFFRHLNRQQARL